MILLASRGYPVYLTPCVFYGLTPSPFIPLPLKKGKGEILEEGLVPLLNALWFKGNKMYPSPYLWGGGVYLTG